MEKKLQQIMHNKAASGGTSQEEMAESASDKSSVQQASPETPNIEVGPAHKVAQVLLQPQILGILEVDVARLERLGYASLRFNAVKNNALKTHNIAFGVGQK